MTTQKITGQLGIVLLLDQETTNRTVELAGEYQEGNFVDLGGRHTPHITLYHSKLVDVPLEVAREYLDRLAERLPMSLAFTKVAAFGDKFLFWDTERTPELIAVHEYALGLAKYFSPAGEQQADKEKITLSPEQDANVRQFGHPLVGSLWRPHVTLGYYPDGLTMDDRSTPFAGRATTVALVRVGEAGTIAEIVESQTR